MSFAVWALIVSVILLPISFFLVSDTFFNIIAWYQMKYTDTRYVRISNREPKVRGSYVEKILFDEDGNPFIKKTSSYYKLNILGKYITCRPNNEEVYLGDNGRLYVKGFSTKNQQHELLSSFWKPYIPFEKVEQKPILKKYPKYEE